MMGASPNDLKTLKVKVEKISFSGMNKKSHVVWNKNEVVDGMQEM